VACFRVRLSAKHELSDAKMLQIEATYAAVLDFGVSAGFAIYGASLIARLSSSQGRSNTGTDARALDGHGKMYLGQNSCMESA